ncbi:MAG: pitrilysin family protein [Gemmatales bacterium]|nr:pitrilysin family protein [Gemmatales bacterium]
MTFRYTRLANGLEIIGEYMPHSRSVAVGFFVKTGARDERPEEAGVSHFLEHMVFKGTERRTALDVNRDFDAIGAHYNACTGEETTLFWATVLPEYLFSALDILADILQPSLRQEDFDTEKQVILEEIRMYEDQPMWSAYDEAVALFFRDHPLGHRILGTVESITALTREQMRDYYQRRYVAGNIVVALAGRFDWEATVDWLQDHCGNWPKGATPRQLVPLEPRPATKIVPRSQVNQEHVFLLTPAPPAESNDRYAAEVLATIVGDDVGSRLYWALIDTGRADSADMSYHEYQGAGAFFTYLCSEPDDAGENLAITLETFRQVAQESVTEEEVAQAQSKLASRWVRGNERPQGRMRSLGYSWVYLHEYRSVDEELARLRAVTPQQIRAFLEQYNLLEPTVVALGPLTELASSALAS